MTDYQTPPSAAQEGGSGMAIASLVLGILSILLGWIPIIGLVSWILAPLGLIFGFIAIGKPAAKGMAIGGLITSGLGLLICIAWVTFFSAVINQAAKEGAFDNLPTEMTAPSTLPADAAPADQPATGPAAGEEAAGADDSTQPPTSDQNNQQPSN